MRRIPLLIATAAALAITGAALLFGCGGGGSKSTAPPPVRELNSGNIAPGGQYQHVFANEGTFAYHCTIHQNMNGTINVSAQAAAGDVGVTIFDNGFNNSVTSVRPGATVTWTNTGVTHTVTSTP